MDFIKTSSLRALTALSRNHGQAVQSGWPRNGCSAVGQNQIRPSKASAKVQIIRPSTWHDTGSNVPRSATPRPLKTMPRTTMPRDPGSNASRPRVLADRGIRSSLFLSLILQVHRSKVVNGIEHKEQISTLRVLQV
ncbi:unnamed protein product [Microthlaspi erraticum]|uniref:Uncharacterized protein n=1 Tax=Microthlaspi erraticum TaxID=1685480 RepID=A0A6D2L5D4_9BRAS|nr:unnamed protein product [Microthlaspi erraticum]